MKLAERIVMVLIVLMLIGGAAWIYFAVQYDQEALKESVARGDFEIPNDTTDQHNETTDWREVYPNTVQIFIKSVPVQASVADELAERIKGLSGTPFLPDNVVKLFVFGGYGNHSIWMKDMNYSIDIIWADKDGKIVHIEEDISPDTYPESFASPVPAWYVVETSAGFVSTNGIATGDSINLP